jgi:hypothetical protein
MRRTVILTAAGVVIPLAPILCAARTTTRR